MSGQDRIRVPIVTPMDAPVTDTGPIFSKKVGGQRLKFGEAGLLLALLAAEC